MSTRFTPYLTYGLIALCFMTFLGCLVLPQSSSFVDRYSLTPVSFRLGSDFFSLFSYIFLHADLGHLVGNMLVLLGVGRIVEAEIGGWRYGVVFLGSGVFSGFLHVLFNQGSELSVIGASGAVFGVIALIFLLMPFKYSNALILPLPGVLLGLFMLMFEVWALMYGTDVYIAHDVHLYGFIIGTLAAFGIDYDRALRGLIMSVIVAIGLYYWTFVQPIPII